MNINESNTTKISEIGNKTMNMDNNNEYSPEISASSQSIKDEQDCVDDAINNTGNQLIIDCKPEPTNWKDYKRHPLSTIFPESSVDGYQKLKESIKDNGLREPIWLYDGQILDGWNRYKASLELDIEPKFRNYEGTGSLAQFVIDLNLHRRHLTEGQKAFIGKELEKIYSEEAKARQGARTDILEIFPECEMGDARNKAAAAVQTNPHYITDAKRIEERAPEVAEKVKAGELTIPKALKLIKQQGVAHSEGTEKNQIRNAVDLYDVIVADPLWSKKKVQELKKLNIPAADNCQLFLWTTQEFLPDAFTVLKVLGLEYVCTLALLKSRDICSSKSPADNLEFCLYATKGTPKAIEHKDLKILFEASEDEQDERLKSFYDMVRQATAGRRQDMFGSKNIEGFSCGGYEASNNAVPRAA